jgi:hypothetical protein
MPWNQWLTSKTFKRELAVVLLVWLVYVVETKDEKIIELLVWPIFTYVTAAFGVDAYGRMQRNPSEPSHGRGTERSSEYPVRGD